MTKDMMADIFHAWLHQNNKEIYINKVPVTVPTFQTENRTLIAEIKAKLVKKYPAFGSGQLEAIQAIQKGIQQYLIAEGCLDGKPFF